MNKLNDFIEEGNNIGYKSGVVRIGDFKLYKNNDEKIIDGAKVGYSIYGIDNLEELKNNKKDIYIVIPALTGNSKIFDTEASQGNGWANTYGKPGNILDPNNNIIIGLDYFGGPHDSSCPGKHNLNFYPVPPEKQVEAWKKALKKLGVTKINTLFGGSNGGGHIHTWLFNNELEPEIIIPVAGPIAPTYDAREFFSLQVDFIKKKEDISIRLKDNLESLKGISDMYDYLIEKTIIDIKNVIEKRNNKKAIKIVRQIGFLKFLNPSFFDKFNYSKEGKKIDSKNLAKINMLNYFKKEGINFEKRFSLSSLTLLSQGIADAKRINPKEYVEKISEKIKIIIISIEDDQLFRTGPMQDYFNEVKKLREIKKHTGKTIIEVIESNEETKSAGHDAFLWDDSMQDISNKIIKNI